MVLLLGAATAVAQTSGTSGAGSTGSGTTSGSDSSRRGQSGSTSGSAGTYDNSSTTGSSSSRQNDRTGTSGTSGSSYGSGSTSTTGAGAMTGRDSAGSDKLSWGDRRFVRKAAEDGHAEHQLAELAAQRATNPEVKSFAQKLVQEHSKANSELMSLASQKNAKVDMEEDQDRTYKRLNKMSGSEFDQEFVEQMVEAHERDVKLFEKAASDAKDPAIRSFASKHVPSLREHLQQAQSLRQSVMPTGRMDSSSGRSTSGGTTGSGLGTSSTDSTSTSGTGSSTSGSYDRSSAGSSGTSGSSSSASGTSGTGSTSNDASTSGRRD
jgi:putative membrane protein